MKTIISALLLLSSISAMSAIQVEEAIITRTPVFNLGAIDVPEVEIVNVRKNAQGSITYADLEIKVQLKPQGCDVSFLREEIVAQFEYENAQTENPTKIINFGSLHTIGVGSTCPGVPARPAKIKINIVNGQGIGFEKNRTIDVLVKAIHPDDTFKKDAYWDVVIPVNQLKGQVEINTITLFTRTSN